MTEGVPKTVDKDAIVVALEKYAIMKPQAPEADPF